MTNAGMFEDMAKIEYLNNQNKLLKQKLKEAVSKIKRLQGLEAHHSKDNGDLRVEINRLEKENFKLKKDIEIVRESLQAELLDKGK
jgi:hypothetical protein